MAPEGGEKVGSGAGRDFEGPEDRPHPARPAQRTDGHPVERHAAFLRRAREPVGILFIGDSITRRWAEVPDLWERYVGRYEPANFGVGGDAIQNVLWRLEHGELDHMHPRVVVLLIGTNNLPTNTAPEIVSGIHAVLAVIRSRLPETPILLHALFPRGPQDPGRSDPATNPFYMDKIRQVNTALATLDDGANLRFLDMGPRFLGPDGELRTEYLPDGLHLVRPGYVVWGEALAPLLSDMMR